VDDASAKVKGRCAVFKKLLLPLVKLGRGDAVLLAHLRQRPLVKKMFSNDFTFSAASNRLRCRLIPNPFQKCPQKNNTFQGFVHFQLRQYTACLFLIVFSHHAVSKKG
jgi:hypothetical protein